MNSPDEIGRRPRPGDWDEDDGSEDEPEFATPLPLDQPTEQSWTK